MTSIEVQVYRCGEWRKITSVQYDPSRETSRRVGDTIYFNRAGAIRQAFQFMTGWRESAQFIGCKMRIAERDKSSWSSPAKFVAITRMAA